MMRVDGFVLVKGFMIINSKYEGCYYMCYSKNIFILNSVKLSIGI